MDGFAFNAKEWANQNFGTAELGDARLTKRLQTVAAQMAANPAGSLPRQIEHWGDLKAAYRLFDREAVTFAAVATPHWERTRQSCSPGRYLLLNDTTEVDFGIRRAIPDLASTGNGGGYGFLLHSALMVGADGNTVHGLAAQEIHYRKAAPKKENTTQRLKRGRESEVWGRVIDAVGPPPPGVQWVHVCDRGADNFEVYCHAREQRTDWIIRVTQRTRKVKDGEGRERMLKEVLADLPVAGTHDVPLRVREDMPARKARLTVRFGEVQMLPPKQRSPYLRRIAAGPIRQWVVWVREESAPQVAKPLEWVLYSSMPVTSLEEAVQVVKDYAQRPRIEEWHKALKSGCGVTERQLKRKERLEPMVAVLSVEAVRLLQLKGIARTAPDTPAAEVIPPMPLKVLQKARRCKPDEVWTVRQFWRGLAMLGGFIGRKGDGEPGWITIWRGWEKLTLMLRGAELAAPAKGDSYG